MRGFNVFAANRLWAFGIRRIASASLTLVGVSVVVFAAIHLIPGSFEEVLVPRGTPEFRHAVAERLGLDRPLFVQYLAWIAALLRGDFGLSLITGQPVAIEFAERIPVTLEIALAASALAALIGLPLGFAAAFGENRPAIAAPTRLFAGIMLSAPDFVVGGFVLYLFSKYQMGLSVSKWTAFADSPVDHLRSLVLPAATLAIPGIGMIAATSRPAALSVLQQDYITAAILRGRSSRQILLRHVVRNASIPVVTIFSIFLGYLLGGTILIEMLFSIPGFGRYLLLGIQTRDYTVVQSGVMIAATFFILANMMTDIAYAWLDPRFRDRR